METRVVILDGVTIGGKSMREHFEVINHNKAIDYVMGLLDPETSIRAIDILQVHEIVMRNLDDDFAGRIRNGTVRIQEANFTPPSPDKLSDLLNELISYTSDNPDNLHVGVLAAIFHHRLVWIHPFFDGNGRTGRLVMNLLLQKHGYPPAIILKNDRKKYYDALNKANNGDFEKIVLLVLQAIERSLNLYIQIIPQQYEIYEPISSIVKEPDVPYGVEYIGLLARTGKINAFKEGRNWVTSKKAVLDYINSGKD